MGLRGLDLDKWTFSSTALVVAVVFGLFPLVIVPLPTLPGGWGVWDAGGALRELSADDCSQISLAGRRLLVLDFVDEQMASGTKALKMAMQMAITTNRTLVEPATGSLSANSNYHRVCPGPRRLAQGQRLGALYDLGQMRTAGLLIMDLEEYWALDRCGLLPVATVLPGSAAVNGSCMRCGPNGNGTTVFTFQHFGRLHAGNRAICAGTPEHALWRDMVSSDTPVLEACCVRKLDGASGGGHYSRGGWISKAPVPFVFNMPRVYAGQFIASHGLSDGYLAVHWRSEQDRTWYKRDLEKEFVEKIDGRLAATTATKVFFAVDFLGTGSTTMNPNGNRMATLMKLYNLITSKYDVVTIDASRDLADVLAASNNMMIAAVEATIMVRATEFLPLVNRGSFVRMITDERSRHVLDPLDS